MRILSLGECMVEISPTGDGTFTLGFAGDTFNTAWALRKFCPDDWQIAYASAVGDDPVSGEMLQFMNDAGICTRAIQILPGETCGLYLIQLTAGERSFSYWRGDSAARKMVDDVSWLPQALADAQAVFLSGISLAILSQERRDRLTAALEVYTGTLVFDPNYRAKLWPSVALARDWLLRMAARADILLPSVEDCYALLGTDCAAGAAESLFASGAREVIITEGDGPVTICTESARFTMAFDEGVAPLDTTGAGDAFNAGYLLARLQGQTPRHAVEQGRRLSQLAISTRGALLPQA